MLRDLAPMRFAGVFVDHVQDPQRPTINGAGAHEVIGPDVVAIQRRQVRRTVARLANRLLSAVLQPLWGHLESFLTPETMDTLEVDLPALRDEQAVDLPVSPPGELIGELRHPRDELRLEVRRPELVAVGRSVLPDQLARPSFAHLELLAKVSDRVAPAGRA
jgi:hypothetical protein